MRRVCATIVAVENE